MENNYLGNQLDNRLWKWKGLFRQPFMETEEGYLGNRFRQPLMVMEDNCWGKGFIQTKQVTQHSIQPL